MATPGSPVPADQIRPFLNTPNTSWCLGRFENWIVLNLLGVGGMGAVFRAVDPATNETVAVKFCLKDEPRFLREVSLHSELPTHPSVIKFHSKHTLTDASGNSMRCFAMEYAGGQSLDSRLKIWKRFPPSESLYLIRRVAQGLAHLHQQGLRHRDLKPANILLDNNHEVKLADFGLAVDVAEGHSTIAGTIPYMAPEIFSNPTRSNYKAEFFSLGVILHELLSGERPFPDFKSLMDGSKPQRLNSIESEVGKDTALLVESLCDKNPDRRLTDADVLDRLLANALKKVINQAVVIQPFWPQVASGDKAALVRFAEEAEPILKGHMTERMALFVGKHEVICQLRQHRNIVNELMRKLSFLIKQLNAYRSVTDSRRLDLIQKEFDKGMEELDAMSYSESRRPRTVPLTLLQQDQTLSGEFPGPALTKLLCW